MNGREVDKVLNDPLIIYILSRDYLLRGTPLW